MRFRRPDVLHDIDHWNRQAAPLLVFGVPRHWVDIDQADLASLGAGFQPLAGVVAPRLDGRSHQVVVLGIGETTPREFTQSLATMGPSIAQRDRARLVSGIEGLLLDGEKAALADYLGPIAYPDGQEIAGRFAEVWTAHRGRAYVIQFAGPAPNHDGYMPFFSSMLANVLWDRA